MIRKRQVKQAPCVRKNPKKDDLRKRIVLYIGCASLVDMHLKKVYITRQQKGLHSSPIRAKVYFNSF